ncbi:MAG: hypothetical protein RL148_2195 [Planctomycetota bacterium]|jgi:hypothetical protein
MVRGMAGGQGWALGTAGALLGAGLVFAVAGRADFEPLSVEVHAGEAGGGPALAAAELLQRDAAEPPQPEAEFEGESAPAPREPAEPAQVEAWVQALRDDGIRGNALEALWNLDFEGKRAHAALEAALSSWDPQQRQLAAVAMRRTDAPPSEALLRVSVDALRREWNRPFTSTLLAAPAAGAVRWLVRHPEPARPHLRRTLGSDDPQQRFLSAYLLARGGHRADLGHVVRELIEHLADNDIAGDAVMACNGLYCIGSEALAPVRFWRGHVDVQSRQLLDLVELNLLEPPRTEADHVRRQAMHRATDVYRDPARDYDVSRSRVPVW